ncbi:MAG: glycosyltransferase [Candidatus Eisenbacteria bacterium]|nr:glycosyltransferase [Candidatus Eisenbacteria bacterium]
MSPEATDIAAARSGSFRPEPRRAPRAAEEWSAAGGVAYVAKMFPRISETFILREILALRREGVPLKIYSLLPPQRDRLTHPQAQALIAEVEILPQPGWSGLGDFLRSAWRCLRQRPAVGGREFLRFALQPTRRAFRRLFRATILADRLREQNVAHIHAAWAHTPASVARIASRLTGIPYSVAGHAKDIHLSRPASLAKKIRRARFVLACTEANRELLADLGRPGEDDLPRPDVRLSYHGVDTDYFSPFRDGGPPSVPTREPVILSVGRLVPKKGFDVLIEAAAILRRRGLSFRLEIVGEGPLRDDLQRRVRELALEDRVCFKGMLVLEDVRATYRSAACMALACRVAENGDRDGIPNTLAEAMAMGLPVVSTRLPSIAELVRDGEDGLLVPPEDPAALAEALERLLTDHEERQRLGGAARRAVSQRFDAARWDKQLARRLLRAIAVERVFYVSADRGVPIRGDKGAAVHVRSLVAAFRRLGLKGRVLTTRPGPAEGPHPGVAIVEARAGTTAKRRAGALARRLRRGPPLEKALLRLLDNVALYREGMRQARAWHPDIVYERYALNAVAGGWLARRLGVPHILEVNAPLAEEEARFRQLRLGRLTRWMERMILRRADRVVVVSERLKEHALCLGVASERILVLPNGVDPELFHPRRSGSAVRERLGINGRFVVGFSGTLKPWHGLHHLLHAAAALEHNTRPDLLVVGDGPGRNDLEQLAQELGLAGRVHFTGAVGHDEVGDYLAACDVLAAPYGPMDDFWFSPLKVVEYLALGRPVIASAIGQLEETLAGHPGVRLLPPGNEPAWTRTLEIMVRQPQLVAQMSAAAASAPLWTWDHVARRILEAAETSRRRIWGWR